MAEKTQQNQQESAQPLVDQDEQKQQFESEEDLLEEQKRLDHERAVADGI